MEDVTETPEPWLWLQEHEAIAQADACGCHLDERGPDGEPGAAFFMCPLHLAAADLRDNVRALVDLLAAFSPRLEDHTAVMRARRLLAAADGRDA